MKSRVTDDFRAAFAARKAYRIWRQNPTHPSLRFKKVHTQVPIYSARVSLGWRVLGLLDDDAMTWFWIGSHADYDRLLKSF